MNRTEQIIMVKLCILCWTFAYKFVAITLLAIPNQHTFLPLTNSSSRACQGQAATSAESAVLIITSMHICGGPADHKNRTI